MIDTTNNSAFPEGVPLRSVKLRCGGQSSCAPLRPSHFVQEYVLGGYETKEGAFHMWTLDGRWSDEKEEHAFDIVDGLDDIELPTKEAI